MLNQLHSPFKIETRTLHSGLPLSDYSFNRRQLSSQHTFDSDSLQQPLSHPPNDKYSSLLKELQSISPEEVLQLFLEQIEENENTKELLSQTRRLLENEIQQNGELKRTIQKKRETIEVLCTSETKNLNLIQSLQWRISGKPESNDHFRLKYHELEKYMHQYINSMNQAQEEITREYHLLKHQNSRLQLQLTARNAEIFENNKICQLNSIKSNKLLNAATLLKEKQANFQVKITNLKEQNCALRKQLEEIYTEMQQSNQFEIELAKENKELSSQLDFIREKINENQNISKDIFGKLQENNEQCLKLQAENEAFLQQNQQLTHQLQTLEQEVETLNRKINQMSVEIADRTEQSRQLREEICGYEQRQIQLVAECDQEREHKEQIKGELVELARQVRLMESTYKQELTANVQIKEQLQKFWEHSHNHPRTFHLQKEPLSDIANQSEPLRDHSRQKESGRSATRSTEQYWRKTPHESLRQGNDSL